MIQSKEFLTGLVQSKLSPLPVTKRTVSLHWVYMARCWQQGSFKDGFCEMRGWGCPCAEQRPVSKSSAWWPCMSRVPGLLHSEHYDGMCSAELGWILGLSLRNIPHAAVVKPLSGVLLLSPDDILKLSL